MKFYQTPWFAKVFLPEAEYVRPSTDSIYLTFDDGPSSEATPWVLSQLEKAKAKATFFFVGSKLVACPEIAKKVAKAGHSVGNHTFNHVKGWTTRTPTYQEEVDRTAEELRKLGCATRLFRPPYGRITRRQMKALQDYQIVLWSHLSYDYAANCNIQKSISELKNAKPGSILVFHDSAKALPNLKQILPELLSHFESREIKMIGLA